MERNEIQIKKIGEKLKLLRKEAGFSGYDAFAWEHGLSRIQYWRMEKGTNFTIKSLLKILAIHKISLKDFFQNL
ncbi:MAG: XRE family transcriptional regulator [Flavobacteriales bacterium]|nr:XRE family transcriptional regulator [Flavobacteriales bacterium]